MVAPEAAPFAKTGGLGDVVGTLPTTLKGLGVDVSLIMPAYRSVLRSGLDFEEMAPIPVPLGDRLEQATVLRTVTPGGVQISFIRADRYFDREYLYGTPEVDYPDNLERYAFFGRAALALLANNPPDVLHAHDWQSALAVTFLRTQPGRYPDLSTVRTAFTLHNLGYQGLFPEAEWPTLGLDRRFFTPQFLEFFGRSTCSRAHWSPPTG